MIFTLVSATLLLAPRPVKATVEEASLFKNGMAVVFRSIAVPASGEYWLEQIPQASLGTLWFATSGSAKLREIVATSQMKSVRTDIGSLDQLLSANVGKQVKLGLMIGDDLTKKIVTGKLVSVNPQAIVIDNGKETLVIARSMITSFSARSGTLKTALTNSVPVRGLRFKVEGAGKILMVSLEKGLTWTPNYAVDITDPKTLKLTAKSTILNDLEDLHGIEARFVTGFPNLPYAFAPDPLTSAPSVGQFIQTIGGIGGGGFGGGGMGGPGGAGILTQNAAGRASESMDFSASMDPTGVGVSQQEDLFFYRQPNVSLKQGDRSYILLFEAKSDYRHLYTWDVADTVDNDVQYRGTDPNAPQEFWHAVKFKNTAGQPLTTAVATTFKNGEILGQDVLKYTSAGAEAELRITKALDIRAEASEDEIDRKRQALTIPYRGTVYDLVTIKGTLVIQNTKPEKVDIKVTKELTGELAEADGEPKATKLAKRLTAVNPRQRLEWTKTLEPGQSVTFTYTYKVYVSN
jgi:hypothetical protein